MTKCPRMHDYKNVYMNINSPICEYLYVDNIIFCAFQYTICTFLYDMSFSGQYVFSCTICALDYMCSTVRYVLLSIICALQ